MSWPDREVIKQYWAQFNKTQLWVRAESLSFHTILGIFPIIGLSFWLLDHLGVAQKWLDQARTFLLDNLNVISSDIIEKYFDTFVSIFTNRAWGWLGLVFLIYSGWSLITKFGAALDLILRVRFADAKPINLTFLKLTLRRAFLMLVLPISLLSFLVVIDWIQNESWFRYLLKLEDSAPFILLPLTWAFGIGAFAMLYSFVPQKKVRKTSALKAACLVVPCLHITQYWLGSFNSHAVLTYKIYGVLAAIPLTIFYIQVAWTIVLAGGLFLKPKVRQR